jgi:hypothetical protein
MPGGPVVCCLGPFTPSGGSTKMYRYAPLGRYWEPQADAIEAKNERTTERSGMLVVHGEQNWDVVLAGE